VISHIVLFEPKIGLTTEDKRSFAQLFVALNNAAAGLNRVSVGRRLDLEAGYSRNLGDKTYSYAAVFEFVDRDSLLAYLRHPLHEKLGALFWKVCERTTIVEVDGFVLTGPNRDDPSGENRLLQLLGV